MRGRTTAGRTVSPVSGRIQRPTRGPLFKDEEEEITVETEDEGIALALSMCEPGQCVVLHEEHCSVEDDGTGCDCDCTTLVAGAKA